MNSLQGRCTCWQCLTQPVAAGAWYLLTWTSQVAALPLQQHEASLPCLVHVSVSVSVCASNLMRNFCIGESELHCCTCACNMRTSCDSCLVTIQCLPGCTAFFRNHWTCCGLDIRATASPRLVMMYCCCLILLTSVKSRDAFDKLA